MYNKACINLEGGYICKCKRGFETIDGGKCSGEKSSKENFFQLLLDNCDHCGWVNASIFLLCKLKSILSDIDECKNDPCAIFQGTCINVDGDFICQCGSAFKQISEKNCSGERKYSKLKQNFVQCNLLLSHSDIDECKVSKICNQRTSICRNLFGGYECACLEGYTKMDEDDLQSSCDGCLSYELLINLLHFL